jgi:hypothetical protein
VVADLHGHDAIPVHHRQGDVDGVGEERLEVRVRAGAVHDHPDLESRGRVDDPRHGVVRREVDRHGPRLGPGVGADGGRHLVEDALAASEEHHVEPTLGHRPGVRRSDPFGGTGHERPRAVAIGEAEVGDGHDVMPPASSATGSNRRAIDASR